MNLLYFWTGGGLAFPGGGSTAEVGVAGISGSWSLRWTGSIAEVGVAGIASMWITKQRWDGSLGVIGVAGFSGQFAAAGDGQPFGKSGIVQLAKTRTETKVSRTRTGMMVATARTKAGLR